MLIGCETEMPAKSRLWLCFLLHILIICAVKIKAGPVEDLIDRLPGQPEVKFKQYGGYVTVDEKAGRALFYYFVEAENDTQSTPLTLWLNGGPGCSSIGGGAFTELGPFYPLGDGRGLRRNLQSWNKVSNLLFVESPVGVGWSYSNTNSDYNRGDESTATDMLTFLSNWIQRFPEYAFRDLFLAGESYAGHYIPQLATKVIEYNEGYTSYKFNLKGVLIGNPLLVLDVDTIATYDYYWSHGLMSDESYISFKKKCVDVTNSSNECDNIVEKIVNEVGEYVDAYDVIVDSCPTELIEQELRLRKKVTHMSLGIDVCVAYERSFYFNLPDVQKSLHANTTKLPYGWTMCSGFLNYTDQDEEINILPALKGILTNGIPILIFSGDQDSVVPLLGTRTNIRHLAHDMKIPKRVPYHAWYHKGQVAGWTISYGNLLTFATIRGASHMVPYAQPIRALSLFQSFLFGEDLPSNP